MIDGFADQVDYAILHKVHGAENPGGAVTAQLDFIATEKAEVIGAPDPKHISTSYVEPQNLSARMTNRRFTRLTNAFSKKIENHEASVALGYFAYNFIKIHRTLRVTPAMAAGVSDRLWDIADLVAAWMRSERRMERGRRALSGPCGACASPTRHDLLPCEINETMQSMNTEPEQSDSTHHFAKHEEQPIIIDPTAPMQDSKAKEHVRKTTQGILHAIGSLLQWGNLFTAVIAGATVFQYFMSEKQWRTANGTLKQVKLQTESAKTSADAAKVAADVAVKSLALSDAGFRTNLRAYIIPETIRATDVTSGKSIQATIGIRNSGLTPALNVVTLIGIKIQRSEPKSAEPDPRPDVILSRQTLPAGIIREVKTVKARITTELEFSKYQSGEYSLFVFSKTTYRDQFGVEHHTWACSRKTNDQWRFVLWLPRRLRSNGLTRPRTNAR